jgi:hypothetical protein
MCVMYDVRGLIGMKRLTRTSLKQRRSRFLVVMMWSRVTSFNVDSIRSLFIEFRDMLLTTLLFSLVTLLAPDHLQPSLSIIIALAPSYIPTQPIIPSRNTTVRSRNAPFNRSSTVAYDLPSEFVYVISLLPC